VTGVAGRLDRLLHLGNVVVDVVLSVPALPERGGDVLASATEVAAGGGFNVMAAAARQGLPVCYPGAHGSGPFGTLARAALAAEGIEVLQPPRAGPDTGFVIAVVDDGGERTFLTSPGAEATLTAADLAAVQATARDAVCLSGYSLVHPANRAALLSWLQQLAVGPVLVFDPGPLLGLIPGEALGRVLARADWLTCNASEASALTGQATPAAAARALGNRAGRAGVLVRTGPAGCLLALPGADPAAVPGFTVDAVDTTGAGDAHTGVFIAALAERAGPAAAARTANAAAALAVTRRGPATAPSRAELARFLSGYR
jgi:sugar/nucleoside kinase (ribokinase family)